MSEKAHIPSWSGIILDYLAVYSEIFLDIH